MNAAREHFDALDVDEKIRAIEQLARDGLRERDIARATGTSPAQIRRILGQQSRGAKGPIP